MAQSTTQAYGLRLVTVNNLSKRKIEKQLRTLHLVEAEATSLIADKTSASTLAIFHFTALLKVNTHASFGKVFTRITPTLQIFSRARGLTLREPIRL